MVSAFFAPADWEAPLKEKDIAARILTEEMENAFQMDAPLVAEAKSGMSWYDAK